MGAHATSSRILGVIAAVVLCASGCAPTSMSTPTPSPTPSSTSPSAQPVNIAVYYLVDTGVSVKLAREYRTVSGDVATAAVQAMIAGALDPGYRSPWNSATRVLGVTTSATAITVNLSGDARTANVGSAAAGLMVQQLVWTVTSALNSTVPVQLQIDGANPGDLWGVLRWDSPIPRADAVDVRLLVQLDTPPEGARVTSPVTVTGEANAFEAHVPWRVLTPAGTVVTSGFTTAREGMVFSPFTFTVVLSPGTYILEVSEDDPSGGAGRAPQKDTKTIVVG